MSDYGPPGPPASPRPPNNAKQLPMMLAYAAGGLGVLGFIWGFLDWYGSDGGGSQSASGYQAGDAAGVIGLTVLAGLWAAGLGFEKKPSSLGPAAAALAALLAVFGLLVSVPDGESAKVGLILMLITALLQAAVLVYAWLIASGRLSAPSQGGPPQNQWQQPPGQQGPGGYPGQHAPQGQPGGYGQPQTPPPTQGPPPGYGQNPQQGPQPPGYGQNPQQGPPQTPQGPPPGYGPNPQQGPPQGPPPGYGQ